MSDKAPNWYELFFGGLDRDDENEFEEFIEFLDSYS